MGKIRRAYMVFGRSKTAQTVYNAIKQHDGITQMDLVTKTKLIGVGAYIRTMEEDEMLERKLVKLPHSRRLVNHYWAAL